MQLQKYKLNLFIYIFNLFVAEISCEALSSAARNAECTYHNKAINCYSSVPVYTSAELSCRQSYHPLQSDFTLNPTNYKVGCNETGHWTPDPIQCVAGPSTINIYVEGDFVAIQTVQLNLSKNLDVDRIIFIDKPEKSHVINIRSFCEKKTII